MEKETAESYQKWHTSIFRTARIAGAICLILMLSVPLILTIAYGENFWTWENIGPTLLNIGIMLLIFAPTAIVENISLFPTLGAGGLILATSTGNVSGMKMPAAISAMETIDAKPGTPEGEVASIIAVGFSALVNNVIVLISVIFLSQIEPFLENPVIQPGFDVVFAALLGAVALPKILMGIKQVWPAIIFVVVAYLGLGLINPSLFSVLKGVIIIIALGISIFNSYRIYKKQPQKEVEVAEKEIESQEVDGE